MDESKLDQMRHQFNAKLIKLISEKAINASFLSREKYLELLIEIAQLKQKAKGKTPGEYQKLKRYDIIKVEDSQKLIFPVSKSATVLFYAAEDELFDILHETHLLIGHGGRNRMIKELSKKFKNVTAETVMVYLSLCESCQMKLSVSKKGSVTKPAICDETESRCQVDLIDMQAQEDRGFKYILAYEDHLTKFVQLRSLKTKTVEEVARKIIEIFTIFGAPSVLESAIGREFSGRVVEEMCRMWSELKIVNGRSCHSKIKSNRDVKNMLNTWLETNRTTKWSDGLQFVQLMQNRAYQHGIKSSPFEAMFGHPAKVGLQSSNLPEERVKLLKTEEELEELIQTSEEKNEDQVEVVKVEQYVGEEYEEWERGDTYFNAVNTDYELQKCDIQEKNEEGLSNPKRSKGNTSKQCDYTISLKIPVTADKRYNSG